MHNFSLFRCSHASTYCSLVGRICCFSCSALSRNVPDSNPIMVFSSKRMKNWNEMLMEKVKGPANFFSIFIYCFQNEYVGVIQIYSSIFCSSN